MFKAILCPLDGSTHAAKALDLGIELAKQHGARLVLAHVLLRNADHDELARFAEIEGLSRSVAPEVRRLLDVDSRVEVARLRDVKPVSVGVLAEIGQHILDAARLAAQGRGVRDVHQVLLDGDAAKRILEEAKREGVDCIVMGSRGLGDVRSLFLGSVSHKVCNRCTCTCIAVK